MISFQSVSQRSRVRVACSACAESKLRCDDQRPCSRCIKLQIADSCQDRQFGVGGRRARRRLRTTACNACSHAKVACSQGRPCPRCVRLGLSLACVASNLLTPTHISRIWAREMAPLSLTLPFPRSVREFFINWPKFFNPLVTLELALSPEGIDRLCEKLSWAVLPEDIMNLRRKLNSLEIVSHSQANNQSPLCLGDTIECIQDPKAIPRVPDCPEFSYLRDGACTWMSMNDAARALLGYSEDALKDAVSKGVHAADNNPNFLPLVYNFFHPDNWVVFSHVALNFYLFPSVICQRFDSVLVRCDGRPLPVHMSLTGTISKEGVYRASFAFTIAERSAVCDSSSSKFPIDGKGC